MPWGRIDDSLYDHPKLDALGRNRLACVGLNTLAQSWCNRWLTDGHVPADRVRKLGGTVALAETLVTAGMWERTDGGYQIHDFLDYNDSREEVTAQRAAARERMREHRRNRNGSSDDVPANLAGSSDDVPVPRGRPRAPAPQRSRPVPSRPYPVPSEEGAREADVAAAPPRPPSPRQTVVAWLKAHDYGDPSGWAHKPFNEMVRVFGPDAVVAAFEQGRQSGVKLANPLVRFAEGALTPRTNGTEPKGHTRPAQEVRDAFQR